ncbi:hypothetical protein MAL08_05735 [Leptospira noguchii]|uniref:hypothetical protein n=1 Tax=Leptospira noguchii TaxID=28182 RepID=UPI00034CB995|nr:hypothetical protein [Leptospira noguchii]UOG38798.1 hypothetical protein MAL08_05735 [Leptospira noguchii]
MPILREAFAEFPGSLCRVALTKAKRFLRKRFRVNKLKSKDDCCIMFPVCNLLTRVEPDRLPVASRIRPGFLMSNSR